LLAADVLRKISREHFLPGLFQNLPRIGTDFHKFSFAEYIPSFFANDNPKLIKSLQIRVNQWLKKDGLN